jgi:hypothetical protein
MTKTTVAALLAIVVSSLPCPSLAKGDGVGLWMEGRVSTLQVADDQIRFVLTGRFWFEQYRGPKRSSIEVVARRGIPVAVTQAEPFFAMSTSWRAGAIREKGALAALMQAAAQHNRVVKFELTDAMLEFAIEPRFAVNSAKVIRATDADLR